MYVIMIIHAVFLLCDVPAGMRVCAHVHGRDYGRNKGRFVTEGEHYSVDDGNDECFIMMVMRITIVDPPKQRRAGCFYCCTVQRGLCVSVKLQHNLHNILSTEVGACHQRCSQSGCCGSLSVQRHLNQKLLVELIFDNPPPPNVKLLKALSDCKVTGVIFYSCENFEHGVDVILVCGSRCPSRPLLCYHLTLVLI